MQVLGVNFSLLWVDLAGQINTFAADLQEVNSLVIMAAVFLSRGALADVTLGLALNIRNS